MSTDRVRRAMGWGLVALLAYGVLLQAHLLTGGTLPALAIVLAVVPLVGLGSATVSFVLEPRLKSGAGKVESRKG